MRCAEATRNWKRWSSSARASARWCSVSLHESQKMETIGQLTGGVAHDFNNLLAVILGSLTLLKKGLPDDPRTSRLLEGAIQGAERGATLTKRLLAFARRQELKLEAVEVQKLVPDMLDFLRQSVGPSISIVVDILPDVHPVKIDANQLELALMNLAVNARDAMPKGGSLTITCRDETMTGLNDLPKALPRGDYVRISVADTGRGHERDDAREGHGAVLHDEGNRQGHRPGPVHGSRSDGAVRRRHAHLQSAGQGNGGHAVAAARTAGRRAADAGKSDRRRRRRLPAASCAILLVDDDSLVSMNTAYMLMDLGHSVLEAPSAAHALQLLETDAQFDVVVTDYAMPGMNGLDLATRIRRLKPKLPIVLATGYAELPPHATLEFPRVGKPYTQEELAEALETALNERRSEGAAPH